MLELTDPDGAFEVLEAYLRAELFGRAGRAADLYLGYGLSQALRRSPTSPPPEPCPLPLAACRVRPADEPARAAPSYRVGEWRRSWNDESGPDRFFRLQDRDLTLRGLDSL